MSKGTELIAQERHRQIEKEGWTQEHDSTHDNDDIAKCGAWYAIPERIRERLRKENFDLWVWNKKFYKPSKDNSSAERIKELTKAGALIAAEIDRIIAKE